MMSKNITKVIIVGAGRSGTNMLRDLLVKLPNCTTWNCDEINPIWKFGNKDRPDDELVPLDANERICRFINSRFDKIAQRNNCEIVIEKTCANSLRVPFVYKVVPDAKFIFITRDGRDVVASAMQRWVSKLDITYTLKKLQYVPIQDLFHYVIHFSKIRLKRFLMGESVLSSWGPVYKGMDLDKKIMGLHELCAKQWSKCVESTTKGFAEIPADQMIHIKYEEFVLEPATYLKRIAEFIYDKDDFHSVSFDLITQEVKTSSVGSYKKVLSSTELVQIQSYLKASPR